MFLISISVLYAEEIIYPDGTCCIMGQYSPTCDITNEYTCEQMEGFWMGENSVCEDCYEGPGTCCLGWGIIDQCLYINWDECIMFEGYWLGKSTDCDDCGFDFGVCCMGTDPNGCMMTTSKSCAELYGWTIFLGLDTDCRFDSCTPECGDVNFSQTINILDVVYLINYKYKNGSAPFKMESAEIDGIEGISILDAVYLISFLYKGGPDPVCPGL